MTSSLIHQKKIAFILVILAFFNTKNFAQELNVDVSVKMTSVNTADPKVFKTLETSIEEFYNGSSWTDHEFEQNERINTSLQLTIKEERSTTDFVADVVIQVIRPVYNSSYSTQIFNHIDKSVSFSYIEFQPLQKNIDSYVDNLSSLLTFYGYIMLGVDFDTFSPLGGESYFQIAKTIRDNVPRSVNDQGWEASAVSNNRYKLIDNLLHPSVRTFREAMYDIHRKGLDIMAEDPLKGRAIIASALTNIKEMDDIYPNSMIIEIFADAKSDEIVEIFKPAENGEKKKIYNIMVKLDAARANKYFPLKS